VPSLVTGLGGAIGFGEGFLQANDDRSTGAIDLSSAFGSGGLYFNGAHYTTLYVNNNGNLTFGSPFASDTPSAFGQGASAPLIIAPYWMDLDTRGPHQTAPGPPPNTSPGGTSRGSNFVWFDVDAAHKTFTATWDDVGYAAANVNNNPAAFQVQLIAAGDPGDFDIAFIYEWTGPAPADQPNIAYAGWSLGHAASGTTSVQLATSGDAAGMAQVDTALGNTGVAGYWLWHIRGGVLLSDTPDPHTGGGDPPPTGGGGDPPPTGGGGDPPPTGGGGDPPPTGGGGDPPPTGGGGDPPPDPHSGGGDPPPPGGGDGGGDPAPPDPIDDPDAKDPVKSPHSVSFGLDLVGLMREGDAGTTPYNVTILWTGDDIGSPSVVDWEIVIKDPNDLIPGQALSGTAVFGVGQREVVIPIGVQGDKVFEQDDMFEFRLTHAVHGDQVFNPNVSAYGVIVNDDAPVVFDFSGPQMRPEGLSGVTPFDFTVVRTGDISQPSTVTWALEPSTADALDFAPDQPLTGQIRFAAGATQAVIQIQVAGDVKPEPDETFTLRLTQATTGGVVTTPTAVTTGTILDDDVRHALLVATPTTLVLPEGNTGATPFGYTLLRTGDLSAEVKIPYALALQGGVSAAEVQSPLSGFVTFAAGSAEAMLTVLIAGDTTPEDNESFSVTLGGGAFNTLTLTGVVMNDDQGDDNAGAAAVAAGRGASPDMGSATSFVQHLIGGSLWGGDGGL